MGKNIDMLQISLMIIFIIIFNKNGIKKYEITIFQAKKAFISYIRQVELLPPVDPLLYSRSVNEIETIFQNNMASGHEKLA